MTLQRGSVPPALRRILPPLAGDLARALGRELARPAALVVIEAGHVEPEAAGFVALALGADGHQLGAAPLERVQALAACVAPDLAPSLGEALPVGRTWVLVLGRTGVAVTAVGWPTTPGGSA